MLWVWKNGEVEGRLIVGQSFEWQTWIRNTSKSILEVVKVIFERREYRHGEWCREFPADVEMYPHPIPTQKGFHMLFTARSQFACHVMHEQGMTKAEVDAIVIPMFTCCGWVYDPHTEDKNGR